MKKLIISLGSPSVQKIPTYPEQKPIALNPLLSIPRFICPHYKEKKLTFHQPKSSNICKNISIPLYNILKIKYL